MQFLQVLFRQLSCVLVKVNSVDPAFRLEAQLDSDAPAAAPDVYCRMAFL